jgi:hypothetical protein
VKKTTIIIKIGLLFIFCACAHRVNNSNSILTTEDTINTKLNQNEISREEKNNQIEEENRLDSLQLDSFLIEALDIAKQNIKSVNFFKEYEQPINSSFIATTNLTIGHLFSNINRHLIIRRIVPWAVYIDIYQIKDNNFKSVINREQGSMTFINDTIKDVNGDGYKDFLVHWYPNSGCCRRDIYNVFLNQSDTGTFTLNYEFINPTFSPKEKVIRGVEYGHPGEVGLYKYKWNGFQVDTIEFIYPEQSDTINRFYLKTNKPLYSKQNIKKEKLKTVPKEYHNIDSFEWFNDY